MLESPEISSLPGSNSGGGIFTGYMMQQEDEN
jgi:hypothetical protein